MVLCNNDGKFEVVVGDLMREDLMSIWMSSPDLQKYRSHLSTRDRSLYLCRTCDNGYPRRRDPPFLPADRLAPARRLWGVSRRFSWRAYGKVKRVCRRRVSRGSTRGSA